jgi:IMP dehydrogenase/GMP reductase
MAARPVLVSIAMELGIDWQGMSIEELKSEIRKVSDKKFQGKRVHYSATNMSEDLKQFLTREYDYRLYNQEGKEVKV